MSATARSSSPWRAELTDAEVARLDPGPNGIIRRPDVMVVGGGVLGVATAVFCARAGAGRVLLVERSALGAGATSGAGGLLTPEAHHGVDPDHFVALARSSLALWRQLQAEIPGGVGVVEMDWLSLEPHPPGFAAELPVRAETLSADEVAELIPSLAHPVPAVRVGQARVNPLMALSRLVGAEESRVAVATGVSVESVTLDAGRVTSVGTTSGPISPGVVVFATGESPRIAGLDLDLPSGLVKGHLLLTEPVDFAWPGSVAPFATQLGGGRLLIGGSLDVGDASAAVRPAVIDGIRAYFEAAVAPTPLAATSHAWCCFRPAHPDHLPVIDRIPGVDNGWLTSGHYRTGIVMAPATAQSLADWIVTGRRPVAVSGFSADRFPAASEPGRP